jgi:hypothetical protein
VRNDQRRPLWVAASSDPGDWLECEPNMAWSTPGYSRKKVDGAGDVLIADAACQADMNHALKIINNWRSSHSFPLNTFQVGLRRNAREIDPDSLIAQRIKRLSSIESKLDRFRWLKLSEMQDIGGCRAVLSSVRRVDLLTRRYLEETNIRHALDDFDDYIRKPKRSGYRGIHLIYRYQSDRKDTYNGLKIEMQFRTPLQHAWATAVETVGTFIQQALKASRGEKEWLRFFALMGTALALREKQPAVPDTPESETALRRELRHYMRKLDVVPRLQAYGSAMRTLEGVGTRTARYFLLSLDPGAKRVNVYGYKSHELLQASKDYLDVEKEIVGTAGAEAVLVSVESVSALRRAYPNYFLDTRAFLRAVQRAAN